MTRIVVSLGQNWAREDGVFPVEDGTLSGRVQDLQSCFNLNSLSIALREGDDDLEAQPLPVQGVPGPARPSSRWMITRRCS